MPEHSASLPIGEKSFPERLNEELMQIEGLTNININDDLYQFECVKDLTAIISKKIIESGAGLSSLSKKEYGLDDIYYRYFEGGEDHE
jgi:ABC-2 type transport system ATP-binding protein